MTDVLVIGSGMAGLSAAIYAARYNLETLVIGHEFGGATSTAWTIENYPGYVSIDGYDLMMKVKEQAEKTGAKIVTDRVIKLEKKNDHFVAQTFEGEMYETKTIILACGAARKKMGLAREDEFALGKGVHYCTTCDGPLYKGKTVAVIGSGDSAVKGIKLAVQYAEKIHWLIRGEVIKAEPFNYEKVKHYFGDKIIVHYNTSITELLGEKRLNAVKLNTGETLELDGLFVEIGALPEVELAHHLGAALDEFGFIKVDNMMETNVDGIYAAGDVTNFFGHFKQDITAAAMGSVAATSAFKHIQHAPTVQEAKATPAEQPSTVSNLNK
ncbi:MAG: FAD-dependent oxidoreductase [Candidatus Berkelbacteria bacterium]|nr:MAG: FAD-dependent oxidoreductase [Candidatus Berkelbacteria bacterium]QQG51900.1 MAG: FAD-dependent oxidoreductase [Candidatus Berkelbacteria bacterium]